MYPQLNDYYKKAKNKQELIGNNPLVIINTSIFDNNNNIFENRIYDAIIQNQKDTQDEKKVKKHKNHIKKN
jgi:hypothetical protein